MFDQDIEIPSKMHKQKRYFFERMKVGESQEFAVEKFNSINSARLRIKDKRFTMRKSDKTCRIWRIS